MNPLNFQLCKLLLPSQLINTHQQKTSLKMGHLFKSPVNSTAPGWECNATEICNADLPLHIPTTTSYLKKAQNPFFVHVPPLSSSHVTEQNSPKPTSFPVCLSELVAADDTAM